MEITFKDPSETIKDTVEHIFIKMEIDTKASGKMI